MSTTPDNTQLIERYSSRATDIGSAAKFISNVITQDLNTPFLSESDKWGLAETLKMIGESSIDLGDRISDLDTTHSQGGISK